MRLPEALDGTEFRSESFPGGELNYEETRVSSTWSVYMGDINGSPQFSREKRTQSYEWIRTFRPSSNLMASYLVDQGANEWWAAPSVQVVDVSEQPTAAQVPYLAGQQRVFVERRDGGMIPPAGLVPEELGANFEPVGAVIWTSRARDWRPVYDKGGPGRKQLIQIKSCNRLAQALVSEFSHVDAPVKLWSNGKLHDLFELLPDNFSNQWTNINFRLITSSGSIIATATKVGSSEHHVLNLLPVEVVSDQAENNGRYDISRHDEALYPRPGNVLAANTTKALENALHLYFHDCAEDNKVTPGSITARSWTKFTLKIDTSPIQGLSWQVVEKPPGSPDLTPNDPSRLTRYIFNLNGNMRGGLYRFKLDGVQGVEPQVWLPLAGPDIAAFWDGEVDYFHNTWGPAYRAKLARLTDGYPATHAAFVQAQNALGDMFRVGGTLDWHNPPGGPPRGAYSPCSGPTNDGFRYTVHGVVVTNWMLNNMMYALIGREMTIKRGLLIPAGDAGLHPFATGSPDDEYTWEAYRIGFYLFEGGSLQDLFHQYGRNMQRPGSWESREWPSWETSNAKLTRSQEQILQELIQ